MSSGSQPGSLNSSPSKNESGVTLRIPIISGQGADIGKKTSRFIRALRRRPSAVSGLFLTRVFAVPAHSHPFRVLADPSRDVRRRSHCALLRRCTARVPEALIFAKCRVSDGAHRDHQLEQAHYVSLRWNTLLLQTAQLREFSSRRRDRIFPFSRSRPCPDKSSPGRLSIAATSALMPTCDGSASECRANAGVGR